MADSRWWKDFDTVVAAALPAGSRVLDVGCGDGGLVNRLGELGFDVLGVDPAAPVHPRLIQEPAEDVQGIGAFDAVTAVMALHHAELDAITSGLTRLLRAHGRLFVYDFDWDAYDERAAGWLAEHDSSDADNSVAGWQREHRDLHTGAAIKEALDARFRPLLETRRPYLARMLPGARVLDDLRSRAAGMSHVASFGARSSWTGATGSRERDPGDIEVLLWPRPESGGRCRACSATWPSTSGTRRWVTCPMR